MEEENDGIICATHSENLLIIQIIRFWNIATKRDPVDGLFQESGEEDVVPSFSNKCLVNFDVLWKQSFQHNVGFVLG